MPPITLSPLEKLSYCDTRECIQKVVDEYLKLFASGRGNFSLFREEYMATDEKMVANSYLFTEALLHRISEAEIDPSIIIEDLKSRLGNNHPVVLFLKQFMNEWTF
ncbi:hypothetical protein GWK48_04435 [Metallosphaera tengchongensis]|uniref:Uncharacterized protein n=1 Tax=Metallosphaera tengchongensis TaxID=1532350 RepID=A0A6N0P0T6_9CREN|nr:hypothetical protein GWK48_04435 [Metallosphaera tengchongensis]